MMVSAPVWVAMATSNFNPTRSSEIYHGGLVTIGLLSILGALLWLIGFLFEAIGDAQLASFLKKNKSYDGPIDDKPVLDTGLWLSLIHI